MLLKRLKIKKILIPLILVSSLTGCKSGNLTIGVSTPDQGGIIYSKAGGPKYLAMYKDTGGDVCMPPDDARTLLQECYDIKPEQSKALMNMYLKQ